CVLFFFFFFFSSRRRHTRSTRDWSSDVCSSDLLFWLCVAAIGFAAGVTLASHIVSEPTALLQLTFAILLGFIGALLALFLQKLRSEERRVGKECRSWWWSEASKEKEEER